MMAESLAVPAASQLPSDVGEKRDSPSPGDLDPSPAPSSTRSTGGSKRRRVASLDESRRREIRETNRIAARECRARKKHLMIELEKTVANLTSEHAALLKQNRELAIRLDTLERSAAAGLGPMPSTPAAGLTVAGLGSGAGLGGAGGVGPLAGVGSGISPSVLAANPALAAAAAAANPAALSAFSTNHYQPAAAAGALGGIGSATSQPRVLIEHIHHYKESAGEGATGNVLGNGALAPSPSTEDSEAAAALQRAANTLELRAAAPGPGPAAITETTPSPPAGAPAPQAAAAGTLPGASASPNAAGSGGVLNQASAVAALEQQRRVAGGLAQLAGLAWGGAAGLSALGAAATYGMPPPGSALGAAALGAGGLLGAGTGLVSSAAQAPGAAFGAAFNTSSRLT